MSFKYKPKIVLKNLKFKELVELYNSYFSVKELQPYFQTSIEENRFCQLCSKQIPLEEQTYGIPISFKNLNNELEVEIFGTYCSFYCSYINYKNMKEDQTKRKNIKFVDSEQLFRCLFYKFFKKFTILPEDTKINLEDKSIRFKKITNIDI